MQLWQEPEITINGRRINPSQAMGIRVAVTRMFEQIRDDEDPLSLAYRARLSELQTMLAEGKVEPGKPIPSEA
jgi:hypothetical protein